MPTGPKIDFLPANHPIQRINPDIRHRLAAAQSNIFPRAFPNALAFVERVISDLNLWLREWEESSGYTGREVDVEVTYLIAGEPWLAPGFVALSINEIEKREPPSYAEQYGA